MENAVHDPIIQRRKLANQYKTIEGQTIPSLFQKGTDIRTWSKIGVLRGVTLEYAKLEDEFRNTAAEKLTQAIELRKQAMPLWPAGTEAAKRHWEWVDILERITAVLRTTTAAVDVETRRQIVESTPAAVVEDEKPWINVDLDIYLQQMAHWRQHLADIWDMAKDDPKQMSVADISTGCAVRYFKMEMAGMELCNKEWYEKSGSYKRETLEYMARREPDGIGSELFKIFESVKRKSVRDIENALENTELRGFPRDSETWFFADRARHKNPLVDWVTDIIQRTRKSKNTTTHAEFLLAWLFISDSMKLGKEHKRRLQAGAVQRLCEVLSISKVLPDIFGAMDSVQQLYQGIAERVQAMTKYVMKQETVPSLAVAYTWADYLNVMLNTSVFDLPTLKIAAYLFDANMILKRWQKVRVAAEAEQFCNRFSEFLYPGPRPTTEAEWKELVRDWMVKIISSPHDMAEIEKRYTDYTIVDKYGKSWVRIAITEDHLTATRKDFQITKGSQLWWQAIKEKAMNELQTPSVVAMYHKIENAYSANERSFMMWALVVRDWETETDAVEEILDSFKFSADWFNGVLD